MVSDVNGIKIYDVPSKQALKNILQAVTNAQAPFPDHPMLLFNARERLL